MGVRKRILLAVDTGNSMTKANWGTVSAHNPMEQNNEFYISKNLKDGYGEEDIIIPDTEVIDINTAGIPKSVVFTLDSENASLKEFLGLPVRVHGGSDVVIQHEHDVVRPTTGSKAEQATTYYSIFSLLYRIAKITGASELDVVLGTCLPLADVELDKDVLDECLIGCHMLGNDVKVNIMKNYPVGECFASSISMTFGMNGSRKDIAGFLSKGKYLVVNIGAGTTDVALFNNMQFVKGSKDTFTIGGNTIRELLISELYKRYRFRISVNAAEQAIKTGKVDIGSKIVSVPELVEEVKRKFSLQLMDTIKRYLTQISQALPELTAVVCVGGGALEGKYVKEEEERIILSTTSYLSDYVKVNAPFTEVLVHSKPRFADADGCWIVLCTKEKTTNK